MAKDFVVVGEDNLTSWNAKTEKGERFSTLRAATMRAADLAKSEPGQKFTIFEAIRVVVAPVGDVEVKSIT